MIITFAQLDASNYCAGVGIIKGVSLLSIDYTTNTVLFSLVKADDSINSAVHGMAFSDIDQTTVGALIRAEIADA